LQDELSKIGVNIRKVEAVHFTRSYTLKDIIEEIASRTYSYVVNIPMILCLQPPQPV